MNNLVKWGKLLLAVFLVMGLWGVLAGCSDGSDSDDSMHSAHSAIGTVWELMNGPTPTSKFIYFAPEGKVYVCKKADNGQYWSGEEGLVNIGNYTRDGDVFNLGDEGKKTLTVSADTLTIQDEEGGNTLTARKVTSPCAVKVKTAAAVTTKP